jgi:hypothetical protein
MVHHNIGCLIKTISVKTDGYRLSLWVRFSLSKKCPQGRLRHLFKNILCQAYLIAGCLAASKLTNNEKKRNFQSDYSIPGDDSNFISRDYDHLIQQKIIPQAND